MTNFKLIVISILLIGFQLLPGIYSIHADEPYLPSDIIELVNSGLSENAVISRLQMNGINFEMNLQVMERLVEGGVSPGIIQVILGLSKTSSYAKSSRTYSASPFPSVMLFSDPPGLHVFVDGEPMGVTPFLSNKLDKGKHVFRVEHPLFFTREESIDLKENQKLTLNWKIEPREPLIRINVSLENEDDSYPWTWIVRTRESCPEGITLKLKPWRFGADKNQALFVLDDESKRLYKSHGTCCLEIALWRGKIRSDLPYRNLPPCTARYLISKIEIYGIQSIDLDLKVKVNKFDPLHPEVTLEGDAGYLVDTGDNAIPLSDRDKRERFQEDFELLFQ